MFIIVPMAGFGLIGFLGICLFIYDVVQYTRRNK